MPRAPPRGFPLPTIVPISTPRAHCNLNHVCIPVKHNRPCRPLRPGFLLFSEQTATGSTEPGRCAEKSRTRAALTARLLCIIFLSTEPNFIDIGEHVHAS